MRLRKPGRADYFVIEVIDPGGDCFARYLKRGVTNVRNRMFENVAARVQDDEGGAFWLTPLAGFMSRRGVKLKALYRSVNRSKLNRKNEEEEREEESEESEFPE